MNTFGEKIKDLRKEKNLTQKELAQQLSITISTLSHWECGYQEPSFADLIILSKYFNCSIDYLLSQEDNFFEFDSLSAVENELLFHFRALPVDLQKRVFSYVQGLKDGIVDSNVNIISGIKKSGGFL